MTDFKKLLSNLALHEVDFILIGGLAAIAHGSARLTQDVDILYSRDRDNLERLVRALEEGEPYLRGAPSGLPFRWNVETLHRGLNFTLEIRFGDIDLWGVIAGGGDFKMLLPHTIEIEVFGHTIRVLCIEKLIEVKRAAGRPKDLEAIAELEAIRAESDLQSNSS